MIDEDRPPVLFCVKGKETSSVSVGNQERGKYL